MPYLPSALLVLTFLPQAPAQDKEAEKLFRAMEKKVAAARAFQVTVAVETGRDTDRPGSFRGFLLVAKDNKARLKVGGVDFGEARRWEMVSDGKRLKLRPYVVSGVEGDKEEETLATPRNLHRHLATRVSRLGVYLNLPRLAASVLVADDPGARPDIGGFRAGVAAMVGGRDAKVVRYKINLSGIRGDDSAFTVWIDPKTLLPLKRVIVLGRGGGTITETYPQFALDPKIDAGAFELTVGRAGEAEKRLRAVQERIGAADAVQATVNIELRAKGKRARGRASLLFTKENQARLQVEVDEFGKKEAATLVADGKREKYAEAPNRIAQAEADRLPARLSRRLARVLSGPGVWLTYHDVGGAAPFQFRLVAVEAGAPEKVGGRDAQVVTYMVAGLPGTDWDVTLWVDAKTGLPLKRVIVPIGGRPGSITETYEIKLNPKVAAGAFRLPK